MKLSHGVRLEYVLAVALGPACTAAGSPRAEPWLRTHAQATAPPPAGEAERGLQGAANPGISRPRAQGRSELVMEDASHGGRDGVIPRLTTPQNGAQPPW